MENTKSPRHVTRKEMLKMNSTASGVKGILETYRIRLNILEESIKADLKSKMEFDRTLEALENRKKDLEFRIKANKHWVDEYDVKVGPQQQQYEDMKKQIAIIYDHAKEGDLFKFRYCLLHNQIVICRASKRYRCSETGVWVSSVV